MKTIFDPMFGALLGGWEILFVLTAIVCGLTIVAGIVAIIAVAMKRFNQKQPSPPPAEKTAAIPRTEIIPLKCPQCGTPLPAGALAGLCPACLLKAGAATETAPDAKQNPFSPPDIAELAAQFPQLEILELIGRGGMGAVYKARQKQLDRIVALKILPPGGGSEPAFAERFMREAKALAKLNHPNIVTLYEFGGAGGQFYFLMEFVDGVNLRQLLQNGRVAAREALAIVPPICDALQFAHDQGIVHRDIKPENILLDRRGRVKVADFGLAKIMEIERSAELRFGASPTETAAAPNRSSALRTDAGKVMGTPPYMSPEQKENPADVDHRADIYALGVVFYQMLTGELPGQKIEPPSKKVHLDVRLDEIVLRALEKKPELRYQQASVFKTRVETMANTPPPADKKLRPFAMANATPFSKIIFWCMWPIFGGYFFLLLNDHFNGTDQKLWHYFNYVWGPFAIICGVDTLFRIRRGLKAKTPAATQELKIMRWTMLFSAALALAIVACFVVLPGCRKSRTLQANSPLPVRVMPAADATTSWTDFRRLKQILAPGETGNGNYGDNVFSYEIVFNPQSVAVTVKYQTEAGNDYQVQIEDKNGNRQNFTRLGGSGKTSRLENGHWSVEDHLVMSRSEFDAVAMFILQKKSQSQMIASRPSFGPVMERTLTAGMESDFLNLNTGEVFKHRTETESNLRSDLPTPFLDWVQSHGISAGFATNSKTGKAEFILFGMGRCGFGKDFLNDDERPTVGALARVTNIWNDLIPNDELMAEFQPLFDNQVFALWFARDLSGESVLHPTLFQTREGKVGLLQILDFTENPRGVKLRYKLAQTGNPKITSKSSALQFRLVAPEGSTELSDMLPDTTGREHFQVLRKVLLDGSAIAQAGVSFGLQENRVINFQLTDAGSRQFAEITASNLHHQLALVYQGKVLSAPVIQSEIATGEGQITGNFKKEEIYRLVEQLNPKGSSPPPSWEFTPPRGQILYFQIEPPPTFCWLDLDSGTVLTNSNLDWESRAGHEWIQSHGLDIVPTQSSKDIPVLLGVDAVFATAPSNAWDVVTAPDVVLNWELLRAAPRQEKILAAVPNESDSYFFKTREGGMGLLQIIGVAENHHAVKIRYKLVQNTNSSSHR